MVNHTWTLSMMRIKLALRSRTFLFFSLAMPIGFLFGYVIFFGGSNRNEIPYLLGAILALTVMGSFWGLSMQLVMFREQGILRRFRLAPIGAGAMLGSSIISNYFLVLPTVIVEFLVCRYVFHMPTWGNLWEVFFLISIGAAAFSALGLIIASVTNDVQETTVINNILWSSFLFLSGVTIPLTFMPRWVQKVTLFSPATYLATGLENAMLRSATVHEVMGDVFSLLVSLIVAFEISRRIFRWEPEEKIPNKAKLWAAAALIPFLLLGSWEVVYGHRLEEMRHDFQLMSRPAPAPPRKNPTGQIGLRKSSE
ncbi:MAG TPA: ABC transporter permease [Candidatus Acidoferrales bacterium]|nr:ABC transporter permease [Candidatus Acidoferrales bacterium]